MKNIFLALAILLLSVSSLFAVPAVPWAVEKVQPDGTTISVFLKGDENVSWMESADGYTLMYDSLRYVVYAQTDRQGNLMPSNIRFGNNTKLDTNIVKGLRYSKAQINTLMQIEIMTENAAIQQAATGNVKVLCILAAFSNRAFVKTNAEFDALMNQVGYSVGGAKGSVKDYYLENSHGLMNLQVTVVGPVTVSNTVSYYGKLADPTQQRYRTFANEVVNLADPLVDYSQFATNGKVESFHIIFAGYGDEAINDGLRIWSHAWVLPTTVIKDGVQLSRYSCSPELRGSSGSNITYIGVIAHELGHAFGSPDYYDVNYSGYLGSGNWDLMASGSWNDNGRQPAHINPYQKIQFGWITPQTIAAGSWIGNMPASVNNPVIYKMLANNNGEHYLLENRQRVGFDASLPGNGLLIWHIAANVVSYAPNNNHPQQVYPVCASRTTAIPTNTPSSYGSINSAGCPFPGTSGKTEFTGTSIPRAFTWTSLASLGNLVTNIKENADKTVSFGLPPVISGPSSFGTSAPCSTEYEYTISNFPTTGITDWAWNTPAGLEKVPNSESETKVKYRRKQNTINTPLSGVTITYSFKYFGVPRTIFKIVSPGSSGFIFAVMDAATHMAVHEAHTNRSYYLVAQPAMSDVTWKVTQPSIPGDQHVFPILLSGWSTEGQRLTFSPIGYHRIELLTKNGCGWTRSDEKLIMATDQWIADPPICKLCIHYSPNPVNGELTIDFEELPDTDQLEEYTVKLLDNLGNAPRQTRFRHHRRDGRPRSVKFNTSSLTPGTYYLHVEGGGELVREQIIVIR
ncbi:MAG: M6 family metalloprotease domain-containing protein [Bacteroidales bacterium]|jgi:M6 family metalloprotease-like protein|nr:M6 family metalloprotease domain-containing protein [Bacteroidales bacterium]